MMRQGPGASTELLEAPFNNAYGTVPEKSFYQGADTEFGASRPAPFYGGGYGSFERRPSQFGNILTSLIFACLMFTVECWAMSFRLQDSLAFVSTLVAVLGAVVVGMVGLSLLSTLMKRSQQLNPDSNSQLPWACFTFATVLLAYLLGIFIGNLNYEQNMRPYYDVSALNTHRLVDPGTMTGQSFMDAGKLSFSPLSHLDLTKSMGFKNGDMYCTVPIVTDNMASVTTSGTVNYDFWAVGTNCCLGHTQTFQCGEWSSATAKSGLRLMRDDYRPFFRLAVEEAKVAYGISANHPVFVTWMENPDAEVQAYRSVGYSTFYWSVGIFCAVQLCLCILASRFFSNSGMV